MDSLTLLPPPEAVAPYDGALLSPISDSENTAPASSPLTIRVLTPEEVLQLAPVFEERGACLPDPTTSFIVGGVDAEGKVRGWLVIQAVIHAEPMYIEHGHSASFMSIVHHAEQEIRTRIGAANIFLFAPKGRISGLAEACGMQAEPWTVFSKTILPDPEPEPEPEPVANEPADIAPEEMT